MAEVRTILDSVGIGIDSPENLVWASNRVGMHRIEPLNALVTDLRALGPTPTRESVASTLAIHGRRAQERSLYRNGN